MLTLIAPPEAAPISLAEVRAQVRLTADHGDLEDALLAGYIRSAVDLVESQTGLRLLTQTWDYTVDSFPVPYGYLRLPLAPLQSIDQIVYHDAQGDALTLEPSIYLTRGIGSAYPARLILAPGAAWPSTWRATGAVTIRMTVGWPDWNGIPEGLRQAALMLVSYWFEQRSAASVGPEYGPVSDVPFSVKQLVDAHRIWPV